MGGALAIAITVLEALPQLIQAGEEVISMIKSTSTALKQMQKEGRDPTPSEWDALNKTIESLMAQLEA